MPHDGKTFAAADAPRNVVLFEREGHVRPVGIGFGKYPDHHVCLPAALAAVVPSVTRGEEAHASGILGLDVRRQQPLPRFVPAMLPAVEGAGRRGGFRLPGPRGDDRCRQKGGQEQRPPKIRYARTHSPRRLRRTADRISWRCCRTRGRARRRRTGPRPCNCVRAR